ncbi:MAG: hypothetical protein JXQ99_15335, partial [Hyphomicrobiaceae bacterium]
ALTSDNAKVDRKNYIWDVVRTSKRMKDIVKEHPKTRKQYLSTMRACVENTPGVSFQGVGVRANKLDQEAYLGPFDEANKVKLRLLGPILERVEHNGQSRNCLRKLGNEGVTKNGHSVILKLTYGKLNVMLGGDLNTQSQDFLLQKYTTIKTKASSLEKKVYKMTSKGAALTEAEEKQRDSSVAKLKSLIAEARQIFECDITKACHHGSHHFSETFLQAVNPIATVISSGDEESHSHPRPDALGAFGKFGRGNRPLIFSTELARSTREFTPIIKYLDKLRDYQQQMRDAKTKAERKAITKKLEQHQDRNVAVYGMITVRALDDHLIIAQKLEEPRGNGDKWDIYELTFNTHTNEYEYAGH